MGDIEGRWLRSLRHQAGSKEQGPSDLGRGWKVAVGMWIEPAPQGVRACNMVDVSAESGGLHLHAKGRYIAGSGVQRGMGSFPRSTLQSG
jgi:hypothetical protein